MDREEVRKAIRQEKNTLQQSLMDEAGTPEETARWLARLEELDREHFGDFLYDYQEHLAVTKRVRIIKAGLSDPVSKAELADMVSGIKQDWSRTEAGSDDEFWDYQAKYSIVQQANPDADWETLISEVGTAMTAEEVVEAGLAQRRRVFAMPGPVDEHWLQEQNQGE